MQGTREVCNANYSLKVSPSGHTNIILYPVLDTDLIPLVGAHAVSSNGVFMDNFQLWLERGNHESSTLHLFTDFEAWHNNHIE